MGRILFGVAFWSLSAVVSRDSHRGPNHCNSAGCNLMRGRGRAEHNDRVLVAKQQRPIVINLGIGVVTASVLTCDLGEDYVPLNADYRS
jgi:N-acetylglutamate synthase/N-acetylornithine aminotransferase